MARCAGVLSLVWRHPHVHPGKREDVLVAKRVPNPASPTSVTYLRSMASAALSRWQTDRNRNLDELVQAHQAAGGQGRGRRWSTQQLNRALLVVLAAEFQGFSKDLHDEAAWTIGQWSYPNNPRRAYVLAAAITAGRQLDRGNASPATLGSDFARFGLKFWDEVDRLDMRSKERRAQMDQLNTARNGIAHSDPTQLARLQAPLTLATFRRWRGMADQLAATIDRALAAHLALVFGQPSPW